MNKEFIFLQSDTARTCAAIKTDTVHDSHRPKRPITTKKKKKNLCRKGKKKMQQL